MAFSDIIGTDGGKVAVNGIPVLLGVMERAVQHLPGPAYLRIQAIMNKLEQDLHVMVRSS